MKVIIYAGEGELKTKEYTGNLTRIGIKRKLTEARCNGQRSAFAVVRMYTTVQGDTVGRDFETDELRWVHCTEEFEIKNGRIKLK